MSARATLLAQLDEVIVARPGKNVAELDALTRGLCGWREAWIALPDRDAAQNGQLERINGVLHVVLAARHPTAETPWDELIKARAWLAGLPEAPVPGV